MESKELTFYQFFKRLRCKRRISLRSFCRQASADPANISRMERGLMLPPKSGAILERYADTLGIEKGSEDWHTFFDLAMASAGMIPRDILSKRELVQKLPLFFHTLRGEKKSNKNELKGFYGEHRGVFGKLVNRRVYPRRGWKLSQLSDYMSSHKPLCYVIAGSNGSGKTTFAREFLPKYAGCINFINPDLIASGLSPFKPENASIASGRIVLQQIHENFTSRRSFSVETTLSGKTYLNIFNDLKSRGYQISMFYLWIPSPELAIQRIAKRVKDGGHSVPSKDVVRRFDRTLSNLFNIYLPIINVLKFFDNSAEEPLLVFEEINRKRNILNHEKYKDVTGKL